MKRCFFPKFCALLLAALLCLSITLPAQAQQPLPPVLGTSNLPLLPYLDAFVDTSDSMDIDEVSRAGKCLPFRAAQSARPAACRRRNLAAPCHCAHARRRQGRQDPAGHGRRYSRFADFLHGIRQSSEQYAGMAGERPLPRAAAARGRSRSPDLLYPSRRSAGLLVLAHAAHAAGCHHELGRTCPYRGHAGAGRRHASLPPPRFYREGTVAHLDFSLCGCRPGTIHSRHARHCRRPYPHERGRRGTGSRGCAHAASSCGPAFHGYAPCVAGPGCAVSAAHSAGRRSGTGSPAA